MNYATIAKLDAIKRNNELLKMRRRNGRKN